MFKNLKAEVLVRRGDNGNPARKVIPVILKPEEKFPTEEIVQRSAEAAFGKGTKLYHFTLFLS